METNSSGVAHRSVPRPQLSRALREAGIIEIVVSLTRKPQDQPNEFGDTQWRAQSVADGLGETGCRFHASFYVDVSGDVRFDQRELVGRQQHSAQRRWAVEHKGVLRAATGCAIDDAIPEPDIERSFVWLTE